MTAKKKSSLKPKTLTIRISESDLLNEIEAIKEKLSINTDSKLIKHLISNYRSDVSENAALIWEVSDLKLTLETERHARNLFLSSLDNLRGLK